MNAKLNPLCWWVLRSFKREERRLLSTGMSAERARYTATVTVVTHGPVHPATSFKWIETHLAKTRSQS
jgi:hypothetical protein